MRVTKAMKDYVEAQMTDKRIIINKAYRAEYDARKEACMAECEAIVAAANKQILAILERYNFSYQKGYRNQPLDIYPQDVRNQAEWDDICDHERKLYRRQQDMFRQFVLECDLGVNKDEFYAMVAAISFDE